MGNVHMEATQINYRGGSKKMSVEEAIKAAGTEITPEEKEWIDTIPELASQEIIAPEFDAEEGVYAVGDLVIYQGGLYKFTTAHETAGAWNPEEVAAVKVSEELSSLESGLTNKEPLGGATTGNKTFAVGGNLELMTDAEGGNINIVSGNNVQFEIDAHTDIFRVWSDKSGSYKFLTWDGNENINLNDLTNKLDNQRNNVIAGSFADAFTDYIFGNETDFYGYMPIIRKKQADGTYVSFGIYEDKFLKVTYDAQGQFVRSQAATFS